MSTIQKEAYKITKNDGSSVSIGSENNSSRYHPINGKRVYKAKEIMNYIHK